jgi:hypothetical protein
MIKASGMLKKQSVTNGAKEYVKLSKMVWATYTYLKIKRADAL